jgi:hypothetical protein
MTAIDNDTKKTSLRRLRNAETVTAERTSRIDTAGTLASEGNMKLIPWADIWASLRVARIRGNGEMIEVFYDTLFKEAIFDDEGAWSLHVRR